MQDDPPTLRYASRLPRKRPPIYALVLGVLMATFLIVFGAGLGCAVIFALYARVANGNTTVRLWWLAIFAPLSLLFLVPGVVGMRQTISDLRGTAHRWPRW